MIARLREKLARERRYRIIDADLRALQEEKAGIFEPLEGDGGIALIVSLTNFVYQLKQEGMMAQAFAAQGLTPVALIHPADWHDVARRYFDFFGVRTVQLPDFAEPGDEAEAARESATLLAGDPGLAELLHLRFHDTEIGRHVLSTASRVLYQGGVDLDRPDIRGVVDRIVPEVVRSTLAAERLLDRLRPELVLFVERNYAAEAPISDIALARGTNVIQYVSAFQDDALVFKRYTQETRRVHPRSLSAESWATVRAMPWTETEERAVDDELRSRYDNRWGLARRNQEWTRERTPDVLLRELGLDPAKPTAVVFSHVLWDANMFYGDDLFADQEQWFMETVRAAYANDAVNWIVKLHPANVWKLRREGREGEEMNELTRLHDELGDPPAHVAVLPAKSDVATRSVFGVARWGVTIRGSVGIELPCLGVPVLTAGTGFYSGLGFTVDSESREEYLGRLAAIQEIPPPTALETELARRHAYALFRLRPLRFTSFATTIRPVKQMGHPLDHDLTIELGSREELEQADDLRRFGEWAVRSRALDYLAPLPGYDRPS